MKIPVLLLIALCSGCSKNIEQYNFQLPRQDSSDYIKNLDESSLMAIIQMEIKEPHSNTGGAAGVAGVFFGVVGSIVAAIALELTENEPEVEPLSVSMQRVTIETLADEIQATHYRYIPVDIMEGKSAEERQNGFNYHSPEEVKAFFSKNPEVDFGILIRSDFKEYRNSQKKSYTLALKTVWYLYGSNGLKFASISTRSVKEDNEKHASSAYSKEIINDLKILQKKNTMEFLKLLNEIITTQTE